jgi:S1-C subfamily serine protease
MKKLLGIVVLGLLWCNVGFAYLTIESAKKMGLNYETSLKEDVGEANQLYNIMAIDWKKYMFATYLSDILNYCSSFSAKSPIGIVQNADCMYKEDVRIIREHNFDSKLQMELLYSAYQTYRGIATVAAYEARYNVSTQSQSEQILFNAFSNMQKVWNNSKLQQWYLFHRYNEKEVNKYLAEKNEDSGPKGLDINDDEIISASSGSGFFVSKEGHIVTNFHVIDNCNVVKVNFKGKEIDAEIFAIDKMNDLAIIQANINPLNVFSVSNKDVTLLQDVIVAGYPLGKNVSNAIKMHKGSITALAGYENNYSNFQTDATINQGNSGGPIIDKYGNVVGVAVATWVEEGVQGIHFGIKSSVLKTFANAKELNFSSPNNREIPKEKLGKLISEATIYLECWMTGAKIKKMIAEADSKKAFFSKFKQ